MNPLPIFDSAQTPTILKPNQTLSLNFEPKYTLS